MWFTSRSHNRQSSISGERRRAHGSARGRAACWPAVVALGLLGGFATPHARAQATVTPATFGNPISTALSQPIVALATADINTDGKPDLVTSYMANGVMAGVCLMLGRGDGSFKTPTFWGFGQKGVSVSPCLALAVGDVNGDGKPDIVAANGPEVDSFSGVGFAIINVWIQTGNANFLPGNQQGYEVAWGLYSTSYYGPTSVTVSDVDGTGQPEIIVGSAGVVDVWRYGSGLLQRYYPPLGPGWNYSPAAVGDVNGDGKPDIVVAAAAQVDVLLNTGNGQFAAAQTYAVVGHATSVALGDVNGDGKPDIVTANYYDGSVNVLLNNGDGTFGAAQAYAVAGTPNSIALGDFNADGKLDIVTTGTAEVDVLLNNGDGTFAAAQAVGPAGSNVVVADFDKDGLPDLAEVDASGTSVDVLLNTSTPPSGGGGGKGHK
jgi:hypothetical protein